MAGDLSQHLKLAGKDKCLQAEVQTGTVSVQTCDAASIPQKWVSDKGKSQIFSKRTESCLSMGMHAGGRTCGQVCRRVGW